MLIYTHLELYYIYVLYDIIYLLQSVPPVVLVPYIGWFVCLYILVRVPIYWVRVPLRKDSLVVLPAFECYSYRDKQCCYITDTG